MPVNEYENSAFSGRPIELFEFIRTSNGVEFTWLYNGSDRDLIYAGETYKHVPIKRDTIRLSGEAAATNLLITMPIAEEFCQQFRLAGTTPSDTVWVRVRRVHAGDVDDLDGLAPTVTADALVIWVGTVSGITQINEVEAKITCSMLAASFRRGGLRYGYQRTCPHVLYAPNTCKVDRSLFEVEAVANSVDGSTITALELAAEPTAWFSGGFIEYFLPSGIIERRMILSHVGDTIVVMGFPAGLEALDAFSAFPGCDRTINTCVVKFDNLDNNGSFPHTPGRNPFDGQPLF